MRRSIIYLHDGSPIQVVAVRNARRDFGAAGIEVADLSLKDAQAESKLRAFVRERGEELLCFYSSNFWALNVRRGHSLLHTVTGIPLVIALQDHPAYFLHYLSASLDGTILFAPGEELHDFIARNYQFDAQVITNPGYLPAGRGGPIPSFEEFTQRKNVILSPMNLSVFGQNIDDIWSIIGALPRERSERTKRLIDAALTDFKTPIHAVSQRMAEAGDPEVAVEDLRWAVTFVKMWRRTRIVEMLVELPAVFSTAYAPPALVKKHPEKFTLYSRTETASLYEEYRFVVNSDPLLPTCVHERVSDSLEHHCVVITDRNALLERYFQDGRDCLFIDYELGTLAGCAAELMEDAERAYRMMLRAEDVRNRQNVTRESIEALVAAVDRRWAMKNVSTA